MTNPYLVIGGTGTVGRHVVRQLLRAGKAVRVMTRDARKAVALLGGVEIVQGDLNKPETLPPIFAGVGKVFVSAPPEPNIVALETAAFDAAKAAGARQIVYLSNFGAGRFGSPGSIWQLHGESERYLRGMSVGWTILRPARFMTDTPFPWAWDKERGLLAEPLGSSRVTMIAPQDVAAVAAKALTTEGHEGQVYELTAAHALNGTELAEALTGATGRATRFVDTPFASAAETMLGAGVPSFVVDILQQYYKGVQAGQWYTTVTAAELLGRAPLSYPEWLANNKPAEA